MINLGLVILIVGLIVWGVGAVAGIPVAVTIGRVVGIIGGVILGVGLVLLLIATLNHGDALEMNTLHQLTIR
jgi:preprotein translocase subunit SecF